MTSNHKVYVRSDDVIEAVLGFMHLQLEGH